MSFVWGRVKAIAQKEVYHVIRDPFTLMLAFGLPIFLVIFFGFAIEFNVKNIHLAINDDDKTQSSRILLEVFASSGYFIADPVNSIAKAQEALMGNTARAALIIPGGFEKDLLNGRITKVQLLLDGSDNSTVAPILSYLNSIQSIANKRLINFKQPEYVNIKTRFLFNSELNSRWFVIPGLIVVIMSILSVLLTALTVAKEWENGSMELMLSTPAEPIEIIVGKLFPYAILVIFSVILVYVGISRAVSWKFVGVWLRRDFIFGNLFNARYIDFDINQVANYSCTDSCNDWVVASATTFRVYISDRKYASFLQVFYYAIASALVYGNCARILS